MVQINKASEHATLQRIYEVADAQPLQLRHRTVRFMPEQVTVTFSDGKWLRMSISGRNIRKDGSLGNNQHSEQYWPRDPLPEWAVPLTKYEED